MALFRPLAALLPILLAACTTMSPAAVGPDYYVMRHLQKENAGASADPGLTMEAQGAARNLASWFDKHPPAAIYVSNTRRAQETAAPVAARHHVTPKIYDPRDTAGLIARVMAEKGSVLVVGHSNTVPDIVDALGGERPPPLADSHYGDIWHVWETPRKTEKLRLYP